jgi:hypothetical protein
MSEGRVLDNYGKPRALYFEKLKRLSDTKLAEEAENKIWASAYAANNPRSDYHWHASACYAECERRGRPDIYRRAYESASGQEVPTRRLPTAIRDRQTGEVLPIKVLRSGAGYYLGTSSKNGEPYSRESEEYWRSGKDAEKTLARGEWSARRHRSPPPIEFSDSGISEPVYAQQKGRSR